MSELPTETLAGFIALRAEPSASQATSQLVEVNWPAQVIWTLSTVSALPPLAGRVVGIWLVKARVPVALGTVISFDICSEVEVVSYHLKWISSFELLSPTAISKVPVLATVSKCLIHPLSLFPLLLYGSANAIPLE